MIENIWASGILILSIYASIFGAMIKLGWRNKEEAINDFGELKGMLLHFLASCGWGLVFLSLVAIIVWATIAIFEYWMGLSLLSAAYTWNYFHDLLTAVERAIDYLFV
jgi:hypothetical protein